MGTECKMWILTGPLDGHWMVGVLRGQPLKREAPWPSLPASTTFPPQATVTLVAGLTLS